MGYANLSRFYRVTPNSNKLHRKSVCNPVESIHSADLFLHRMREQLSNKETEW